MAVDTKRNRNLRVAGAITLAIGLILVAVGAESLAVYNACVADPACLSFAAVMNVGAFFAILAVGIVLAVAGVWVSFARRSAV